MNTEWQSRTDEPPRIPGVYEVKMNDGTDNLIEAIAGKRILAYWDGVDTWSYPWCLSVHETYRSKMMPADRMLVWRGDPLPTEPIVILKIIKRRPAGGAFDVKMDLNNLRFAE